MPTATAKYELPWEKSEEMQETQRVYIARYTPEQLAGLEQSLSDGLGEVLLAFEVADTEYQQVLRLEYSYEYDEQEENGANTKNLAQLANVDAIVNAWVALHIGG